MLLSSLILGFKLCYCKHEFMEGFQLSELNTTQNISRGNAFKKSQFSLHIYVVIELLPKPMVDKLMLDTHHVQIEDSTPIQFELW